jgi:hypothetical protein
MINADMAAKQVPRNVVKTLQTPLTQVSITITASQE